MHPFGFGGWNRKNSIIDTILLALPENLKVKRENTILVGLSAGGYGVAKEIQNHPEYRGAVFVSAVVPKEFTNDKQFVSNLAVTWNKKPLIIFGGTADHLVTPTYTKALAESITTLDASLYLYEGEGHFLFLTKYQEIFDVIKKRTGME